MASLLKREKRGHKYYVIRFHKKGMTPYSKEFWFRADKYKLKQVRNAQIEMELKFRLGDWNPWKNQMVIDDHDHQLPMFKEMITVFLDATKHKYADSTLKKHRWRLQGALDHIGNDIPISRLSVELFESYVNNEKDAFSFRKTKMASLRAFQTWLRKAYPQIDRFVPELKASSATRRKGRKTYITKEELDKLCAVIPPERQTVSDMFRFAFFTGVRLGEITNMKVSWIQGDYLAIGDEQYRPKSDASESIIPLPDEALEIVRRHSAGKKPGELLFTPYYGNSHYDVWVSSQFRKFAPLALPDKSQRISFHKLRDSCAMYWLHERKIPVHHVQRLLRHGSLRMTEIYLHYNPEELRNSMRGSE